jgi:hypothetical protein
MKKKKRKRDRRGKKNTKTKELTPILITTYQIA